MSGHSHGVVKVEDGRWPGEPALSIDGYQIAKIYQQPKRGEAEENARRLAACVNACVGIPTEALEVGTCAEFFTRKTKQVEQQRDELRRLLGLAYSKLIKFGVGNSDPMLMDELKLELMQ